MIGRAARGWLVACGALLTCAGCGFKGNLYLPERNTTVVTHAAQSAQGAPSPAQIRAPGTATPASVTKKKATAGAPQPSSPPQSSSPATPPPP
jgi:predicted small lipoprotein YifL